MKLNNRTYNHSEYHNQNCGIYSYVLSNGREYRGAEYNIKKKITI